MEWKPFAALRISPSWNFPHFCVQLDSTLHCSFLTVLRYKIWLECESRIKGSKGRRHNPDGNSELKLISFPRHPNPCPTRKVHVLPPLPTVQKKLGIEQWNLGFASSGGELHFFSVPVIEQVFNIFPYSLWWLALCFPQEKRTPLHYAAMRGKRRIVEVLLLFGANVSLLTKVKVGHF